MRDLSAFARELLSWFETHRRDLPWRRRPEPWRVLVAETMLQQTRVAAVLPRFDEFLARFPDPPPLAAADVEEVLALWSGLGYYRRARHLHAAARRIVELHGGRVPGDAKALRALPGVGAYTAGAVLSIAFGQAEPIVDGNVERVFARAFLIRGNVKRGDARRDLWALALALVKEGPPDRINQGVMELGSLVCLPRTPRCPECPVEELCAARREGVQAELPELPAPPRTVPVTFAVALARRGTRLLIARGPEGGFLAGTWGPPFAVVNEGADPARALEAAARDTLGLNLLVAEPVGTVMHAITHHRIEARCFATGLENEPDNERARFVEEGELGSYGLSSLARKSFALMTGGHEGSRRP